MAQLFVKRKHVQDKNAVVNMDFVVTGEIDGDKIRLAITNQLTFKKETWIDNASDYLPVEYKKFVGYKVVA